MAASRPRISVVNDTESFLSLIRDALDDRFEVTTFNGEDLSVQQLIDSRPDLLMIDLVLRGRALTGWEVVQLCRTDDRLSKVPIIVCSADRRQLRQRAGDLRAFRSLSVLEKPFGLDQLDAMIDAALNPDAANADAAG